MQKNRNLNRCLKAVVSLGLSALLLTVSAFAKTAAPMVKGEGKNILIGFNSTGTGNGTMIYVIRGMVASTADLTDEVIENNLVWSGSCADEGDHDIAINLPDYGGYSIVLGGTDYIASDAKRIVYYMYIEPGIEAEAIATVSSALQSGDDDEVFDAVASYNERAYLADVSAVGENTNKKAVLTSMLKANGEALSATAIGQAVNIANDYELFVNGSDEKLGNLIVSNKEVFGIEAFTSKVDGEVVEDITVYKETVAAYAKGKVESEGVDAIRSSVRDGLALTALNNAVTSEKIDTIMKYNEIFSADISEKLDLVDEYSVEKILDDIVFDNTSMVESLVNGAITRVYNEKKSESGGSSGGSSGSSKGGYAVPSTINVSDVDDLNENPVLSDVFTDIADYEWAKTAITYVYEKGIMSGDGKGNFRPGDNLTREEFVKILINALGGGKTSDYRIEFNDVSDDAWYKPYICIASELGIVNGLSEDTFGIGQQITREDAAVMLKRAGDVYTHVFQKKQTLVDFTDYNTVSDYALSSVDTLARAQIINGYEDGSFKPQGYITRSEIAKVIYSCLNQ